MTTKLFEVRDHATCMPAIAIAMEPYTPDTSPQEALLLRRAGYGDRCILFGHCEGGKFFHDPYEHGDRTRATAHDYIVKHWDQLTSGDIIDVRFILGETQAPAETDLT